MKSQHGYMWTFHAQMLKCFEAPYNLQLNNVIKHNDVIYLEVQQ